jgi:formylglycine-generating enzyme required for sulfatase activity
MVRIPGGTFTNGVGPNEELDVATFFLDTTEVTVAQYGQCVQAGACTARSTGFWEGEDWGSLGCNYGTPSKSNHPMNCVNWQDAANYCAWANKRLPTEWEWEWAARGRDEARTYPWGDSEPTSSRACSNRGDEGLGTCAVGTHPDGASRDGVQDLAGNVSEWTSSRDDGEPSLRVLRGGSWLHLGADAFRADDRIAFDPSDREDVDGFRCAKTP